MAHVLLTGMLVLFLTGCRSVRTFTPEEVLQKSMQASAALSSVSFVVRATHTTGNGDHTNMLLQSNVHQESQQHDWQMRMEQNGILVGSVAGISVGLDDLYLHVPGEPYAWYHVPRSGLGNRYTELTVFPLPATFLTVVQDLGQTQIDHHTVYRYDVAVREMGVLPPFRFTGTLWIDAESFLLRRSTWDITTPASQEVMKIDSTLQNYNAAPIMHIPTIVEEWLPHTRASIERIFETIPPSLSLLLGMPKVAEEMQ